MRISWRTAYELDAVVSCNILLWGGRRRGNVMPTIDGRSAEYRAKEGAGRMMFMVACC